MADATASSGGAEAGDEQQLTSAGIGSLSAQELVSELAKRGAPTSGNDGELVRRANLCIAPDVQGGLLGALRSGLASAARVASGRAPTWQTCTSRSRGMAA